MAFKDDVLFFLNENKNGCTGSEASNDTEYRKEAKKDAYDGDDYSRDLEEKTRKLRKDPGDEGSQFDFDDSLDKEITMHRSSKDQDYVDNKIKNSPYKNKKCSDDTEEEDDEEYSCNTDDDDDDYFDDDKLDKMIKNSRSKKDQDYVDNKIKNSPHKKDEKKINESIISQIGIISEGVQGKKKIDSDTMMLTESIKNGSVSKSLKKAKTKIDKALLKTTNADAKESLQKYSKTLGDAAYEFEKVESDYKNNVPGAKIKYDKLKTKYNNQLKAVNSSKAKKILAASGGAVILALLAATGFLMNSIAKDSIGTDWFGKLVTAAKDGGVSGLFNAIKSSGSTGKAYIEKMGGMKEYLEKSKFGTKTTDAFKMNEKDFIDSFKGVEKTKGDALAPSTTKESDEIKKEFDKISQPVKSKEETIKKNVDNISKDIKKSTSNSAKDFEKYKKLSNNSAKDIEKSASNSAKDFEKYKNLSNNSVTGGLTKTQIISKIEKLEKEYEKNKKTMLQSDLADDYEKKFGPDGIVTKLKRLLANM